MATGEQYVVEGVVASPEDAVPPALSRAHGEPAGSRRSQRRGADFPVGLRPVLAQCPRWALLRTLNAMTPMNLNSAAPPPSAKQSSAASSRSLRARSRRMSGLHVTLGSVGAFKMQKARPDPVLLGDALHLDMRRVSTRLGQVVGGLHP